MNNDEQIVIILYLPGTSAFILELSLNFILWGGQCSQKKKTTKGVVFKFKRSYHAYNVHIHRTFEQLDFSI